jgi:hypothetical protein
MASKETNEYNHKIQWESEKNNWRCLKIEFQTSYVITAYKNRKEWRAI